MKTAPLKALLVASLRTADPVGTSRRVVAALAAKAAEVRTVDANAMQPFRAAFAEDMQPLGEALWQAIQTTDPVAMRAGLRKLSRRMGDFTAADALGEELAEAMAEAFIAGAGGEPIQAGNYNPNQRRAPKGQTFGGRWASDRESKDKAARDHFGPRYRQGMTPEEAEERLEKVIKHALAQRTSMHSAAWREGLGRIDLPWGTPGDQSNEFKGGHGLSHVLAKHGEKDVRKLAGVLARGEIKPHEGTRGEPPDPRKRQVETPDFIAVVIKDKQSRAWLLTGFTPRTK
jgi:hypothetical protein